MPRTPKGSAGGAGGAGGPPSTPRRRSPRGLNGDADAALPPAVASTKRAARGANAPESKAKKPRGRDSASTPAASDTAEAAPSSSWSSSSPPKDEQAAGNGSQQAAADEDVSGNGLAGPAPTAMGAAEEEAGPGTGAAAAAAGGVGPAGGPPLNSRREAFAQVARVRGAHFARPDKKPAPGTARAAAARGSGSGGRARRGSSGAAGGAGGGGAAASEGDGPKELWPGPFAEARRLMDNREAAAALRESIRVNGRAQAASDDEEGDTEEEGDETPPPVKVEWAPRGKGSRTGKSRAIPSLFRLCLNLLADHFDHIESLGDVSPEVRNHLAAVMCRELKLTTEALQRLSEPGVTELILPDCSRIEPDQMRDSLLQCRQTLRVLRLGTCGRCVGDATLGALAKDGGAPRLEIASLAGTYQMTDAGVLELLACCPRLTGLELPANSRITVKSLEKMVDTARPVGMSLTTLSLADCIQLGTEELEPLKGMSGLQRLSLSGLVKLTDATLLQALEACGWRLRHLDISDCTGLTDASLRAVGERCGVLESFSLGMCPLLTTGAIQELFQYSGSSADASKGFRAPAASGAISNGSNADGDGDDGGSAQPSPKGKGKGKGKGKASVAAAAAAAAAAATSADAGSAGAASGAAGPVLQDVDDEEGDGDAGASAGHAMLKSRLTSVSLRGLVQVDDKAVTAMAAACSGSLRTLDLKGLALVTDNSMVALARYCSPSLESLDLSFCRGATDDGLGHLVDSSTNLKSLRLWGCTQVTDRFLKGHSREELAISRY